MSGSRVYVTFNVAHVALLGIKSTEFARDELEKRISNALCFRHVAIRNGNTVDVTLSAINWQSPDYTDYCECCDDLNMSVPKILDALGIQHELLYESYIMGNDFDRFGIAHILKRIRKVFNVSSENRRYPPQYPPPSQRHSLSQ